jgi:peptide/nickel transport system substrate-binding protein
MRRRRELVARALTAAVVALLVAVAGVGGAGAQTPKRGGTVVIAGPVPTCLDPLWPCTAGFAEWGLNQVIEGAFEIGPDLTFRPNLVSKVDVAEEPFTLTYHIRPEARWSDGEPVTASDFVFTFQAFRAVADGRDPFRAVRKNVRRVAALDAKTFRVSFRSPLAGWRELFHLVLPRHALVGEDLKSIWQETIDNPKTGEPIGSGPFLVERLERDRQLILARNPRYWGPHTAYLGRIIIQTRPADVVEAFRSTQVDIVFLYTAQEYEGLRREPGIRFLVSSGSLWEHFEIQLGAKGHPALKSRLVRHALAYGVDREAVVRGIYGPTARALDSVVFAAQSRFYRPHWKIYRYRPAEARRLLAQAGCRRGADGIYVCAGKRLSLNFQTTTGSPPRGLTLQLVQAQLRRVGVEVVPVFAPSAAFLGSTDSILERGDFDVALFAWQGRADELSGIEFFGCGGRSNHTGYCNRQVTRDLLQAELTVDAKRRAVLLNRVDEQLAGDVPVLPLYQVAFPIAVRGTIRGVVHSTSEDGLTWNSENWWLED